MKRLEMFFVLCLTFIAFNSCQNNEASKIDDEITLSQQETQAEVVLSDVDLLVDEAIAFNASQNQAGARDSSIYMNDCPIITVNNETSPKVMTIDFGTSCTGKDGKIRSGKIIVTTESFTRFSSVRNKSFENYYVDEKKIEGSIVKTILKDTANNIRTAVIHEDITITFPDNEVSAHRLADLTRQYQRNEPGNNADNQIVSWGTVEFTRVSGVKATKTITAENPLVFKAACHQIVSGIVSFTTSDNRSWTIDYGNGDCDNIATLTKNGKTKEITLH